MSVKLTISNLSLTAIDYEGNELPSSINKETGETQGVWTLKYALLILITNYKPKESCFETKLAMDSLGQRIYHASAEGLDRIVVTTSEYELLCKALEELAEGLPAPVVGFVHNHLGVAKTMTAEDDRGIESDTIESDEN